MPSPLDFRPDQDPYLDETPIKPHSAPASLASTIICLVGIIAVAVAGYVALAYVISRY